MGQASTQARHPSRQRFGSSAGAPRYRSGRTTSPSGKPSVRRPWLKRVRRIFHMDCFSSEVDAAVGEVEALVAEREVGDLLAAQGQREPAPVVERRVDHLVCGERPAASVTATWQISPRHPSTRETHSRSGARRPSVERGAVGPSGSAPDRSPRMNSAERSISSQRTQARANTSPLGHAGDRDLHEAVEPGRVVHARVASEAGGARRGTDETDLPGLVRGRAAPVPSKRASTEGEPQSRSTLARRSRIARRAARPCERRDRDPGRRRSLRAGRGRARSGSHRARP